MKKVLWPFFEVLETVAIAIVAVVIVRTFVVQPFVVSGASMEPTFYNGNYLLVDELTYRFRPPERGEVIVFRYPEDPSVFYIKRIIGLPGDRVTLADNVITVYENGAKTPLQEKYLDGNPTLGVFDVTVPQGDYFVLGDNRNFSYDSRSWGPLPAKNIIGLVRLRLWPLNEADVFSAPAYPPSR